MNITNMSITNFLTAITINTQNLAKTFEFLLLGMVLMFMVMTVLYFAIRLLNATDKHNDKIKAFFKNLRCNIKAMFTGKKNK